MTMFFFMNLHLKQRTKLKLLFLNNFFLWDEFTLYGSKDINLIVNEKYILWQVPICLFCIPSCNQQSNYSDRLTLMQNLLVFYKEKGKKKRGSGGEKNRKGTKEIQMSYCGGGGIFKMFVYVPDQDTDTDVHCILILSKKYISKC